MMQTREYLNQISRLNRMINNKLVEIQQLREMACNVTAIQNDERVKTSPDPDRMGVTFSKIDEMEKELDRMIDGYVEKKNVIISQIDSMDDENEKEILLERYINFQTISYIAQKIGITVRGCQKKHKKALENFDKKYNMVYKTLTVHT